jgi:hypothetical protein
MNHRSIAAATVVLAALGLAGCSSGSGSTSAGADSSAPLPSGSTASTSAVASASVVATKGSSTPAGATGYCRLIDQGKAEGILGETLKPGLHSAGSGSGGGITKVDGCTYLGTKGSLGYAVVTVKGMPAAQMLAAESAKLQAESKKPGSPAKTFDTGLPQSVGFILTLPTGVDAQVTAASGDWFVTVAVTRKDGNKAASQAAAISATKTLLAAH